MPGLVLAGTASGVGKTVATLAAVRALGDAGYAVRPAKAGPDFIDPSQHATVADRPSRTLDPWLQGEAGLRRNYRRGEGDVCVVEGAMGLYDGDVNSTAAVAEALDLPVVLVVDASAGMESVAATALGFREYATVAGRDVDVVGVVAQQAHGGRHETGIREALPEGLTYFGRIPPLDGLDLPERHLGLHRGDEAAVDSDALAEAASHLDAEALVEVARTPPKLASDVPNDRIGRGRDVSGDERRIAVARDAAFCFVYPATLERLGEGGQVITFSPVAGDDLPPCDAVYLPGGYPELHAETLSESATLDQLGRAAAEGLPVFGECGGMMALAESLTTVDGERYDMAGVLPASVEMHDGLQALEMVELEATADSPLRPTSGRYRGHEFHYSRATPATDARFAFETIRGHGIDDDHEGLTEYATLGTYAHFHPESGLFDAFLDALS
ncbi:cobyrinic acid a,c-diamide synthase [Halomarina salina]|uniref:Cobyrinate a,c-diamide synthase n=1 Tax=Halomarina salina TaxID=1872699 RepID=A0ABD5RHC1_9EURY|nr:cobyrinic acid a,c-diamide synthase [Halomarina salina]